ncbi:hypothetical protein DZ694_29875, partial [Klebsiella pneumoniae]
FNQGVSLDAVRTPNSDAHQRKPQGALEDSAHPRQVQTNDCLLYTNQGGGRAGAGAAARPPPRPRPPRRRQSTPQHRQRS